MTESINMIQANKTGLKIGIVQKIKTESNMNIINQKIPRNKDQNMVFPFERAFL